MNKTNRANLKSLKSGHTISFVQAGGVVLIGGGHNVVIQRAVQDASDPHQGWIKNVQGNLQARHAESGRAQFEEALRAAGYKKTRPEYV